MRNFKTTMFLTLCLLVHLTVGHAQEVEIGSQLKFSQDSSDIQLKILISKESEANVPFQNFLGRKVIILDFWATWCGSCIVAMPHLDSLQKEFKDELDILAVGVGDKEEKMRLFMKKRPYSFVYAMDEAEKLRELFPFRSIPHTVLINKQGEVVAITESKNITRKIIHKVIRGEKIELPLKKDNFTFDMFKDDYFEVDPNTKAYFDIQPGNPDVPGFTRIGGGDFHHKRRVSMLNTVIANMYLFAFEMKSRNRLVFSEEDPWYENYEDPDNRYCMDLIVEEKDTARFHEILREKLNETFDIKARKEVREKEVYVLTKSDEKAFSAKRVEKARGGSSRNGSFELKGASLDVFARNLETFASSLPVVNETGIEGFFEIEFSYLAGDKESFYEALDKMGLKLEKKTRMVEVLYVYEEKESLSDYLKKD